VIQEQFNWIKVMRNQNTSALNQFAVRNSNREGNKMEQITRKQIDRMVELLQTADGAEGKTLAEVLKDADVIPKLYQYAYVESMYKILNKFKSTKEFMDSIKYGYSDEKYWLEKEKTFTAVLQFLSKAHKRQDEICDFQDSILAEKSVGSCQDDDHYENIDPDLSLLNEEQRKKYDEINDSDGWYHANDNFKDIFNPEDQELFLILNYNDDETKVSKSDGYYVCNSCLEVIRDNSEGNISCDMDMALDAED